MLQESRIWLGARQSDGLPFNLHVLPKTKDPALTLWGPYKCLQISEGWVSGGWGQTLFSSAQRQDKGQWPQTEA